MGEYFLYVCVTKRHRVIAMLNPQRGFGGMAWGQFLGTQRGQALLNDKFCLSGCKWIVVSDYGYSSDKSVLHGDLLYDRSRYVKDIGLNRDLRESAMYLLATGNEADMWNNITQTFMKMKSSGKHSKAAAIANRRLRSRVIKYFS